MRCPKCHYISFESADRCRNCGYDLSLASVPVAEAELPLNNRTEDPAPPVDLTLESAEAANDTRRAAAVDAPLGAERLPAPADLPLFKPGPEPKYQPAHRPLGGDDEPLVRRSAVPRAPIAVRRATPDTQRLRSRYSAPETPRLDLEANREIESFAEETPAGSEAQEPVMPAPPVRRLVAAVIDALIVNGINLGVLYFTLRLCGLPLSTAALLELPAVPLVGFLLLLDGGYFVTFTAVVGQTIGKMAMRLRVVHVNEAGEDGDQPNLGSATLRTAAYGASFLPVGLGFLPALVSRDRRALHDRLAETRVIFSGKLMV